MAHHSIGSIREMVRQYREELSCQTAHDKRLRDKRPSVSTVQKLCWHETPHARTGTCSPLRFRMVEFQELDRRAAEVLRRSQPVISEGRQACKSPPAPSVSKHRSDDNGHSVERRSERSHCRSRDVVARNFEEIDKILGESNLIMEQSSSSGTQHKVLSYNKGGVDTPRMLLELKQGIKHVKQDVEAREVAAIKAANDYLNKSNGHSNILLENLPQICAEEVFITTCRRSMLYPPDQPCPSNTNKHELPTTVSLRSSCNGTKSATAFLESKRIPVPESERQWLSEGVHSALESQQFPKRKPVKKPCKSSRDICSIQEDLDLLVSESQRCTGREVSCLELDDMKQLSTEDFLLILENPRKVCPSLKPNSKDRIWEGRATYCPQRYLSPGKTSTVADFESSFAGDLDEEATRLVIQRSKVGHSEDAIQLLGSSAKCTRGSKEKGNRSPAWIQSLNVRKPSKWRAMSNTHTRSAASQMKGSVAVEEHKELARRCSQPEGAAATVNNNNNFKTILQDNCKKSHSPAPTTASNELPNGIISLPRVATIRENPHVSIAPKDVESTFSSGLNSLISEVVHEWVEECSSSSLNLSVRPGIGSITDGQALETGIATKKSLPVDSELVQVARKKSVEALASVVQPLLAALQEAEVEDPIVTEFEADETVRLLLEKLHFYEKRVRAALKKREESGNCESSDNSLEN